MSESEPLKIAIKRFNGPYSCSQAVFSAFAPRYGLSDELALKIAAPLGGGMARQGHVCGAVSGALMVLGLARGSTDPLDKEAIYQLGKEFIERFEALHATVLCRELIGYDFSVPEEARAAREARISSQVCPAFVHTAAEILVDLLG
jgi:C_GCAxxG_C_C family probable redox protein